MGPTRPEALTFNSKLWSDFYFSEKGIPILRFFLGLMIFTFVGAPRLFLWAGPSSLVRCFQELPLFMHWIPPIPTG